MAKNNNKSVIKNISWKFAERITAQIVTLVVSIVLARILDPSHYGVISIVSIFITLANVFVSDGFGSALIQKKDTDELDFSSVLYFNIVFSLLLYCALWVCAPLISKFYGEGYEILTPVLRVLGIRIIVSGVNSVQHAYVSRMMIFEKFFWATLFGTILSAIVGIWMAYNDYGVWALVAQYLTNTTVDTIVLAVILKKIPRFHISINRLKNLLNYGWKILFTKLLITGYQELRALIIGKLYSSQDLAYYDKGKQFPALIVNNIDSSISAVLFPAMSREQQDITRVKTTTRQSIRFSAFLMCPLMLGLAAIAETFVSIVLTDKWLPCVPFVQIFCVTYLFQPIHSANMQAIKAVGRSDTYLILEIIKKSIELIVLIFVMRISVNAIAISMAILTFLFVFVNSYPNKKILDYSVKEQISDLLSPVLMSLIMMLIVHFIGQLQMHKILLLFIQVIIGAITYVLMSYFSKNEEFAFLLTLIKNKLKK